MNVHVKGKGDFTLTDAHFLAQGGQASIFARDGLAFKLYTDPSHMIPTAKIKELGALNRDNIIRPLDVIQDKSGKPIGYTMRHLSSAHPLCQTFTKTFRDQYQLGHDTVLKLVRYMQDAVDFVHKNKCLIVDLNELNFLLSENFKEVYFLDVDSYQTPSFKATALMESVRDRHTKGFSELTDWFAFGVVSFQMFIGIHPYKGKHPSVKTMDERMIQNISVFNKDVSVPKVCYPFDVIPEVYRNWYRAVFEQCKRVPPPNDLNAVIQLVATVQRIAGGKHIDVAELFKFDKAVVRHWYVGDTAVTLTDDGFFVNTRQHSQKQAANPKVGVAPKSGDVIAANIKDGDLTLFNVSKGQEMSTSLKADSIMECDGRLYYKYGDKFNELHFLDTAKGIATIPKTVATVLPNASKVYDGVLIQNLLGKCVAYVFPKSGICHQIMIDELKGYQVVNAKYEGSVLMVVGAKGGKYDKFVMRLSSPGSSLRKFDLRKVEDVSYTGLNFVVLDNGICVHINHDEEIEVFSNREGSAQMKVVDDPAVSNDMVLSKHGVTVVFSKGDAVYSMKLK